MSIDKTKEDLQQEAELLNEKAKQAREKFGQGDYASIEDEVENFKSAYSAKDKAISGGKIVGKSLFNIGKFTVGKAIPEVLDRASKMKKNSK